MANVKHLITYTGVFLGVVQEKWTDPQTGEVKQRQNFKFGVPDRRDDFFVRYTKDAKFVPYHTYTLTGEFSFGGFKGSVFSSFDLISFVEVK